MTKIVVPKLTSFNTNKSTIREEAKIKLVKIVKTSITELVRAFRSDE